MGAYGAILASDRLALRSILVWYESMYDLEKQAASQVPAPPIASGGLTADAPSNVHEGALEGTSRVGA